MAQAGTANGGKLRAPADGTRRPAPFANYRRLARVTGFKRLAAVGMASKLAPSMAGLSLLLLIGRDYSYGVAGLTVSASVAGQGLTAPLRGRLVDRRRPGVVLLCCLALQQTATALLVLAASVGEPAVAVVGLATVTGGTAPPVAVMMRSLWHGVTDPGALPSAMALDSTMTGTALISGPLLASWLSLSFSPVMPFLVTSLLTIGTVTSLTAYPPVRPTGRPQHGRRFGPPASNPLRRLLVADGLFVTAVTALDVVLPIYARQSHSSALAGPYLGVLSIGSVAGSFAMGAASTRLSGHSAISLQLSLFAAGSATLAVAARYSPWAALGACPAAGLVIGSLFATLRTEAGGLAPQGSVTETMSWLSSLDFAGGAAGASLFTRIAGAQGSRAALMVVPLLPVAAASCMWCRRGRPSHGRDHQTVATTTVHSLPDRTPG